MKIFYFYIILVIILVYLLPKSVSMILLLTSSLIAIIGLLYSLYNESNDDINNRNIPKLTKNQSDEPEIIDTPDTQVKPDEISLAIPYNSDNYEFINDYYKTQPYEEQFADYGLSLGQKNLLNLSDKAKNNASNYNYNKFSKWFGDEMEIKYEDAWYGVDT